MSRCARCSVTRAQSSSPGSYRWTVLVQPCGRSFSLDVADTTSCDGRLSLALRSRRQSRPPGPRGASGRPRHLSERAEAAGESERRRRLAVARSMTALQSPSRGIWRASSRGSRPARCSSDVGRSKLCLARRLAAGLSATSKEKLPPPCPHRRALHVQLRPELR